MSEYPVSVAPQASDARNLDWLISRFVDEVSDAAHAIPVSADGLLMAASVQHPE